MHQRNRFFPRFHGSQKRLETSFSLGFLDFSRTLEYLNVDNFAKEIRKKWQQNAKMYFLDYLCHLQFSSLLVGAIDHRPRSTYHWMKPVSSKVEKNGGFVSSTWKILNKLLNFHFRPAKWCLEFSKPKKINFSKMSPPALRTFLTKSFSSFRSLLWTTFGDFSKGGNNSSSPREKRMQICRELLNLENLNFKEFNKCFEIILSLADVTLSSVRLRIDSLVASKSFAKIRGKITQR